jgi:hypothetical protein
MDQVDKNSELFHSVLGHITVIRSALEMVKMKVEGMSEDGVEMIEEAEARLGLLVKDLERLREETRRK